MPKTQRENPFRHRLPARTSSRRKASTLHGNRRMAQPKYSDFTSYHEMPRPKKEFEMGQFFTPRHMPEHGETLSPTSAEMVLDMSWHGQSSSTICPTCRMPTDSTLTARRWPLPDTSTRQSLKNSADIEAAQSRGSVSTSLSESALSPSIRPSQEFYMDKAYGTCSTLPES